MIRIGVIGYGYWGPNLVRNFSECAGAAVTAVCDTREERLAQVRRRYPAVAVTTSAAELCTNPSPPPKVRSRSPSSAAAAGLQAAASRRTAARYGDPGMGSLLVYGSFHQDKRDREREGEMAG